MAELPWVDFTRLHSVAHLVAATVLPTRTAPHLSRLRRLLNQLIREQAPGGDFATAIVRVTDISPKSTAAFPLRPTRIGWRRWSRRVPRIRLRPRRADGRRIEPSVSAQRRRWRWLDCLPRNARSGGHRKTHRRSGWPQKFQKDTATYRTFFVFVG
jgi:hypothetical protein